MKRLYLLLTSLTFAMTSFLTACEYSSQRMEKTEKQVMKSEQDLDISENQVLAEIQIFRLKTDSEIKANFRRISAIQDTIDSKEESYEDKLEDLDKANREIKHTINNFTDSDRDQWTTFRDEFSDSMDRLAYSLNNFFDSTSTDSTH